MAEKPKLSKPLKKPVASKGKASPLESGKATLSQQKKDSGPSSPAQVYVKALKRLQLQVSGLRKKASLTPAQEASVQQIAAQIKEAAGEAQKAKPDAQRIAATLSQAHSGLKTLGQPAAALEGRLGQYIEQARKLF
jgi:hypothetical protein